MLHLSTRGLGVALLAWLLPAIAVAATYGDTAYASAYVAHCADSTALTLPINVAVSSRIYVSARAGYLPGGNNNNETFVHVELRNGADTTTLATSQQAVASGSDYNYTPGGSTGSGRGFSDSDGLLHAGTNYSDTAASIYVAAPGNYVLQMHVSSGPRAGVCAEVGGGSGYFNDLTLTYLLLSSAYDRIFADGFQAMLGDGSDYSIVA